MHLESKRWRPETQAVRWGKVTLIGVGLLGGSLGLALKERRLARKVVGFVRRRASIRDCLNAGAVDAATLDLQEAVEGADLAVLCTPPGQFPQLVKQMLPHLRAGAFVTDVGSVKVGVARDLEPLFSAAGVRFVGSHPMAGSEKTGVAAARADLFEGATCVVTPTTNSSRDAIHEVGRLWKSVGGDIVHLTPEAHDKVVSRSSHLPQVIASTLAACALARARGAEPGLLCGNGFRDTTRIASSSPEMWCEVVMANRENLLAAVDDFSERLQCFRRSLKKARSRELRTFFRGAKRLRDNWLRRRRID